MSSPVQETHVNTGESADTPKTAQSPDHSSNAAEQASGSGSSKAQAENMTNEANLTQALAEAKALATTHYDALLRATAEAENARRRAQEDVAKAHKYAIERLAEYLLPVMDSMNAALADSSDDAAKLREGVELTMKQLSAAFEKARITEVNPLGEKFNPHCHQAISMVPAEQEPNTVVTVLQRGYLLADRVLRPALVTVAQPK